MVKPTQRSYSGSVGNCWFLVWSWNVMATFIQVKPEVNERLVRCRSYVAKKYRLHLGDNEMIAVLLNNFCDLERGKCVREEKEEVRDLELF